MKPPIQQEQTERTQMKRKDSVSSVASCSNRWRRRLRLRGEKLFERGADLDNVNIRDLPNDVQVNICIVLPHRRTPHWKECAVARSDWAISPKTVAAQNPPGDLPHPPPPRPFQAIRQSKPVLRHRASPAGPHRCQPRCHRARQSQKSPGDGWDASRRRAATGSAILAAKGFRDVRAHPEDN